MKTFQRIFFKFCKKVLDKICGSAIIAFSFLREIHIQRISVMVAHQTLTLFVRVRILHPLPEKPANLTGNLPVSFFALSYWRSFILRGRKLLTKEGKVTIIP